MIKEIIKDGEFLRQKSSDFDFQQDIEVIQDLIDTAEYYKERCVGLAAPQIGVHKKAIVILTNEGYFPMINPVIFWKDIKSRYTSVESCLSVDGEHYTKRFNKIKVNYQDKHGRKNSKYFTGYTAKIIQHEVDHLNGILI